MYKGSFRNLLSWLILGYGFGCILLAKLSLLYVQFLQITADILLPGIPDMAWYMLIGHMITVLMLVLYLFGIAGLAILAEFVILLVEVLRGKR